LSEKENERVRVAINMLKEDFEELKRLAAADGDTISGYLKKALATEIYIKEKTNNGGKVLIEEDGLQREVIFR